MHASPLRWRRGGVRRVTCLFSIWVTVKTWRPCMMSEKAVVLSALATGAVFKIGALSWLRKRRREKFIYVGDVSGLWLYPVKSCRPTAIDRAECTDTGLRHNAVTDRHWVVVDNSGSFISQRKEPTMALIQTRILNKEIELSAPGVASLLLRADEPEASGKMSKCRVWDDHVTAMDCGDKAGAWVSRYLGMEGCRLMMYIPQITQRQVSDKVRVWKTYARDTDKASFGDYCSYFLCSEESLADLNTRLDTHVTMMTFRPNIVVKGCSAYAEDDWMEVKIGDDVVLRYLDACPRCTLTTVDPYRGVKNPDQEPLKTLRSFRLQPEKYGNSPLFGTYLGLEHGGTVKVGDPVYALPWPKTP